MAQPPPPECIYQLRLVLSRMSPLIWRRFLVSSETSIAQLHDYIQIAFAWIGEHLHRFRIQGKDYGIAYVGGISFDDNPHRVPLSCFRLHLREHFRYEYDFTAPWQVQIRLEKILPLGRHRAKSMPDPWLIYSDWIATAANFPSKHWKQWRQRYGVGW